MGIKGPVVDDSKDDGDLTGAETGEGAGNLGDGTRIFAGGEELGRSKPVTVDDETAEVDELGNDEDTPAVIIEILGEDGLDELEEAILSRSVLFGCPPEASGR